MTLNIFFSLLSFLVSLVLAFVVSPLILTQLGDTRYGVWALFGELLGYLGLIDFGIRGGVNYFVGRTLANKEDNLVAVYTSSAFAGMSVVSSVCFAVAAALVFVFSPQLAVGGADQTEVVAAALIFLLLFALGLPLEMFAGVLSSSRRVFIVSASEMVSRVVSTLLMLAGLLIAPTLYVLCAAQAVGRILYWILVIWNVRRYVPQANISRSAIRFSALREMFGYGSKAFTIDLASLAIYRKDVIFITAFLGPQLAAAFTFPRALIVCISEVCSRITQVIRPNLIHHWARQEFEQAYTIYYTIARYSSFVVLLCAAFLVPFGSSVLELWIGKRFVEGDFWNRSDVILYVLLACQIPRMMHSISWQLLFATGKQESLRNIVLGEAICNVALAFLLVRPFGTVGLAIATAVPMLISHVIVMPLVMQRVAGVSLRRYITEGVGRPIILAAVLTIFGYGLRQWIPPVKWAPLFLNATIVGSLGLLGGVLFVIRPVDRRALLHKAAALRTRLVHKKAHANATGD